jgi:ABC-type uncharacterized transport system fused permease/ATPase subunit
MGLQFTSLQREADLRFALVRVRENCESIAFYGGASAEAACVEARFCAAVATKLRVINWQALLAVWKNVYSYSTILVPSSVTAPRYFAGEIKFGVVTQVRKSASGCERDYVMCGSCHPGSFCLDGTFRCASAARSRLNCWQQ